MPTRIILNEAPTSRRSFFGGGGGGGPAAGPLSPLDLSTPTAPSRKECSPTGDVEAGPGLRPSATTTIQQRNVKFTSPAKSVDGDDATNGHSNIGNHKKSAPPSSSTSRKTIKLKSSLFYKSKNGNGQQRRALSKEDIRASSRLLGYLFQSMTSAVMLISVLKFFFDGERENKSISDLIVTDQNDARFWITPLGPVFRWKLFGCVTTSGVGTIFTILIIAAHFDTIAFPDFWKVVFQDGSRYEQYICITAVLYWAAAIHINTSTLSVGEVQANVFFTTWIAFFSSVLNFGVWRVAAGKRSIEEFINEHPRETTFNWLWTFFSSSVCAGAMTSTYANRQYLTFKYLGEPVSFSQRDWTIILTVLWGFVVLCIVALVLNHYLKKSCEVRVCKGRMVLMGWRQFEGFIALGVAGTFFYLVFTYTGIDGFINGLNNTYFGLWGTFINSVFLLATWLRENKNIDIIKKEEKERMEKIKSHR